MRGLHRLLLALAALLGPGCGQGPPTAGASTRPATADAAPSAAPLPARKTDTAAIERARGDSPIKSDEVVELFPAYAWRREGGWSFELRAWIYEPEGDDALRGAFLDELVEEAQIADPAGTKIARERIARFLVDNERDKRVSVAVAGRVFALEPSEEDGHMTGRFSITEDEARAWATAGALEVAALTRPNDARSFATKLVLVADEGLTVVSDIDDTVKITEVTDKKRLLRRTFGMPFEVVPGMGAAYAQWVDAEAHLHFVSSSPWQLFAPLSELMHRSGFPVATYDLKRVRPRDVRKTTEALLAPPLATKPPAIRALLERFPKRRVVLVGDSGEKDPEVYGLFARERPQQVARVYIRDVTGEPRSAARYAAAFEGVPADKWTLFSHASELPAAP